MTRRRPGRVGGFSLIELLMALVIAGVLAAIALPSYSGYVTRARRVSGRSSLVQLAHWLERVATTTGRYPAPSEIPPALLRSEGAHYLLTALVLDDKFTLDAIPQGGQSADRCGTLSLLQSGERKISNVTSDTSVDACWNR